MSPDPGLSSKTYDPTKLGLLKGGGIKGGSTASTGATTNQYNSGGGVGLAVQEDEVNVEVGMIIDVWDPILASIFAGEM